MLIERLISDFLENNENPVLCSECKGKCCKGMGCHFSPRDFDNITYESLNALIERGNISIDWWEGDVFGKDEQKNRTYYLRMRNKGADVVNPSWGGECILLTDQGCILPFEQRPLGGKSLIPCVGDCKNKYTKEDCCKEWQPYEFILQKLVDKFK